MKRPIIIAIIGYIIGILWGLYLKINIILFYFLIIVIHLIYKKTIYQKHSKSVNNSKFNTITTNNKELIHRVGLKKKFKLISFKRYFRYVKLIIKPNVIYIIIIFSIISNIIINFKESEYEQVYKKEGEVNFIGIILSNKEEKEYYNRYKIKVVKSNNHKEFEQKYLYIQVKKSKADKLKYGDMIQVYGVYSEPSKQRNYGGFNYQEYLKTKKICGIIEISHLTLLEDSKANCLMMIANNISLRIKNNIDKVFDKEKSGIIKGILLGDTSNIEEQIKDNFRIASMSHILAISGMHISYIIIGITKVLKRKIGKRNTKIMVIAILITYMFITGCSASVIRATIMGIILIISGLVYRKNDIWTSMSISLFIILIYNPYLIIDIGLQLSYLGTIGIIIFNSMIFKMLDNIKIKKKRYKKEESKVLKKIKEILSIGISAQIIILPVMLYHFNIYGPYFIISNFLISIIIGPIIILGFIFCMVSLVSITGANILKIFLDIGIQILILISKISNLPFSKIYIPTPSIINICTYLIALIVTKYLYFIYHTKTMTTTQRRVRNLIALLKYKIYLKKRKYFKILIIFICVILCFNSNLIPRKLKIYFIDVGQGDSTFIVTPRNKTILIDGGGSELGKFDVGKNILIPYILDRGYNKIDYIFVSHFDSDHVGGILSIMQELEIKNAIISEQGEDSENYKKFLELVNEKNIKLIIVKKGDKIKIEDKVFFKILWPQNEKINENILNNNSIVMKLVYNNFSMLFTGDIEAVAEREILKVVDNKELRANILKVAHHGSKTSSTEEFLRVVKPQITIIGVGKNNNFGHPNEEVLKRLENIHCKIYRTDEMGEVVFGIGGILVGAGAGRIWDRYEYAIKYKYINKNNSY